MTRTFMPAWALLLAAAASHAEAPGYAEGDFASVEKVDVHMHLYGDMPAFAARAQGRRVPRADDQRQLPRLSADCRAAARRRGAFARSPGPHRIRCDIRRRRQRRARLARKGRARARRVRCRGGRRRQGLEGHRHAAPRPRRPRRHDRRRAFRSVVRLARAARPAGARPPGRAPQRLVAARRDDDPRRPFVLRRAPAVPHGRPHRMAESRAAGRRARPHAGQTPAARLRRRAPRVARVGRGPHRGVFAPLPERECGPRRAAVPPATPGEPRPRQGAPLLRRVPGPDPLRLRLCPRRRPVRRRVRRRGARRLARGLAFPGRQRRIAFGGVRHVVSRSCPAARRDRQGLWWECPADFSDGMARSRSHRPG